MTPIRYPIIHLLLLKTAVAVLAPIGMFLSGVGPMSWVKLACRLIPYSLAAAWAETFIRRLERRSNNEDQIRRNWAQRKEP
jgi:hypothetical protein